MLETLCQAYNYLGMEWGDPAENDPQSMETILYHTEYDMFTEDASLEHQIDNYLYFQVLNCHLG